MLGARQRMLSPALHPTDFFTGEAFAEHVLAHEILLGSKEIGLVLNVLSEVAQHLHRALVGDVRAGCIGQPAITVHHHIIDAIARQKRGSGRPRRTGSDNEDVC